MEVKNLFWELVFDWVISSDKQQTIAFLNAATFLVRDTLHAFFKRFSRTAIQLENLNSEPDQCTFFFRIRTLNTVDNLKIETTFYLVSWLNNTLTN